MDAFDSLVVILDEVTDDLPVEHLGEDLAILSLKTTWSPSPLATALRVSITG